MNENSAVVRVEHLKKHFPIEKGFFRRVVGHVRAVDGVSFEIQRGSTLGLVGESGCGKTTLGRCIVRALEPTSGKVDVTLGGTTLSFADLSRRELRPHRRHVQMVFQDPYSSIDPRMTVFDVVAENLRLNSICSGAELDERVRGLVNTVGLDEKHLKRYPHAFSGGQRQRIGIARALATDPALIVADEAVSALDVSVQAQILNLMRRLQKEMGLTYLFIAHDLSVVEYVSDEVAVMYLGRVVERARTESLFAAPKHPYTEALLSAIPEPNPHASKQRIRLPGEVGDPSNPPPGCHFHPRCRYAEERCRTEEPALRDFGEGHYSACHFAEDLTLEAWAPVDGPIKPTQSTQGASHD